MTPPEARTPLLSRRGALAALGVGVLTVGGGGLLEGCGGSSSSTPEPQGTRPQERTIWTSIDTQADSRDRIFSLSKEAIQRRVADIADANATHIGIGTPYSSSDRAMLEAAQTWIGTAREHGLNVIWRAAMPEWEGWFGAQKQDKTPDYLSNTYPNEVYDFIKANPTLFENGDMFDPCAEAENELDVYTGDNKYLYRKFLADVDKKARLAFHELGKDGVEVIHSMNGDVPGLLGYDSRDGMNVVTDVLQNRLYFDWSPYNYQVNPPPYDLSALIDGVHHWQQVYPGAQVHLTETGITLSDIAQQAGNNTSQILAVQQGRVKELLHALHEADVRGVQYYSLDNKDSSLESDGGIRYPSYAVVKDDFGVLKGKHQTSTTAYSSVKLSRRSLLTGSTV